MIHSTCHEKMTFSTFSLWSALSFQSWVHLWWSAWFYQGSNNRLLLIYRNKKTVWCMAYGGNSFFLVNGSTTDIRENKWCNEIIENVKLTQLNKRKKTKLLVRLWEDINTSSNNSLNSRWAAKEKCWKVITEHATVSAHAWNLSMVNLNSLKLYQI